MISIQEKQKENHSTHRLIVHLVRVIYYLQYCFCLQVWAVVFVLCSSVWTSTDWWLVKTLRQSHQSPSLRPDLSLHLSVIPLAFNLCSSWKHCASFCSIQCNTNNMTVTKPKMGRIIIAGEYRALCVLACCVMHYLIDHWLQLHAHNNGYYQHCEQCNSPIKLFT